MSVVGLDFGNLSVLIGQAGRGGVDVILNDSSNRQTASYVSIQGKQRFLGDSGSACLSREDERSYGKEKSGEEEGGGERETGGEANGKERDSFLHAR